MHRLKYKRYLATVILFCLLPLLSPGALAAKNITIGMLVDGEGEDQRVWLQTLRHELSVVLGSKYRISMPESKVLSASWISSKAEKQYSQLVNNPEIDIIIAAGILTSSVVLQSYPHRKPVIVIGVVDPLAQKISLIRGGASGVNNLTYVLFNRSLNNDLIQFHKLFPYKKVGIIIDAQLHKTFSSATSSYPLLAFQQELKGFGVEHVWLPVDKSINDALDKLGSVDALYIGYLGRVEGEEKAQLIAELNRKKLPTFSPSSAGVDAGVLASMGSKRAIGKVVRRIVLNIEAILEGENPSTLPVHLSFDEKLTINMQTAREIEFSPTFSLLSQALLINDVASGSLPSLSLGKAIKEAVAANMDLKIQASNVKTAELNVTYAKTNYFPSVGISNAGTQIDEERATTSFGQQAEKSMTVSLKLEQLLYSESQFANVDIQRSLLTAERHSYEQLELDIVLDTATAFFDILRARTAIKIQDENLSLIRQYLDLAKQREVAGYSGLSDVYHWEIQLSNATTQYLSTVNNFRVTKIQLNKILNKPLAEQFNPEDIATDEGVLKRYLTGVHQKHIDTPAALEKFTGFSVSEALANAPEIAKLDASIRSQERRLVSSRKKRYLPNIALVAERKHVVYRGGIGSDLVGVDPEDDSWTASINVSLPLFEGGSMSVEAHQISATIMQLKDQRRQVQQAVEFRVRAALLGLVTQTVNLKSSQKTAYFAEKNLLLVQDAYKTGKATVVELSDAQNTSISSHQKALNAVYEFLTELLKTERAVGVFNLLSDEKVTPLIL